MAFRGIMHLFWSTLFPSVIWYEKNGYSPKFFCSTYSFWSLLCTVLESATALLIQHSSPCWKECYDQQNITQILPQLCFDHIALCITCWTFVRKKIKTKRFIYTCRLIMDFCLGRWASCNQASLNVRLEGYVQITGYCWYRIDSSVF